MSMCITTCSFAQCNLKIPLFTHTVKSLSRYMISQIYPELFSPVLVFRKCPQVHVGPVGYQIQDCYGSESQRRNSHHSWVRGSINDVLIPIESYHLFDPFGRRVKHETRFNYDRIPAVVKLCIQAGIDLQQYPSRRRAAPVRMIGKKVIDSGGFVDEPKPHRSEDSTSAC
jgi:hypothetical protein